MLAVPLRRTACVRPRALRAGGESAQADWTFTSADLDRLLVKLASQQEVMPLAD
jgi:hypothetical protein